MADFLDNIVKSVKKTVETGYYKVESTEHERISLKDAVLNCNGNPVIAEVKLASPSKGVINEDVRITDTALSMQSGGAVGISILTEPKYFKGSLNNFNLIRNFTAVPLLMKDFILSPIQVDAASAIGADAILLIQAVFDRGYCERDLDEMIGLAHSYGMEVLLEAHTEEEFRRTIGSTADLLGINNRDLAILKVDLNVTERILRRHKHRNRIIVSESGIESPDHLRFLRDAGAEAFLVGTAVMRARDIEVKVRELVEA